MTVLSSVPVTFGLFSSGVTRVGKKIKQLDKSLFQTKLKRDANNNHDKQAECRDPGCNGTGPYWQEQASFSTLLQRKNE